LKENQFIMVTYWFIRSTASAVGYCTWRFSKNDRICSFKYQPYLSGIEMAH